jgi:serine phosphatase RsbU (regulator of sigma subunit)
VDVTGNAFLRTTISKHTYMDVCISTEIPQLSTEKHDYEKIEIIAGLKYAAFLQQGILPKQRHFDRIFSDSFTLYLPYQFVSGDFYWVAQCDDLTYLAVGDCMGHGVPGAMLSILVHRLLDYAILNKRIKKTNKILREIDHRFIETFNPEDHLPGFDNDWVDLSLCCIDTTRKTIYFSGAKRSVVHVSKGNCNVYSGSPYPIGGWQIESERSFDSTCFCYSEGDVLYLLSDGFQDQTGGDYCKKYKAARLYRLLGTIFPLEMKFQKEILETEFFSWKGAGSQIDDVCLVGVRL